MAQDDDPQLDRDLSRQLDDLAAWNDNKDSDKSWERDAARLEQQKHKRAAAPSVTAGLGREVAGRVATRLGLILVVLAVLLAMGAVAMWFNSRNAATAGLAEAQPTPAATEAAAAPQATITPTPPSPAAIATMMANAASRTQPPPNGKAAPTAPSNKGKDSKKPGGNAANKPLPKQPGKMGGPNQAAAPPGPDAPSEASQPTPVPTPTPTPSPRPTQKSKMAATHRTTHSPALMAQLNRLWQSGRVAKHRGDYATARRDWQAALRLCQRHPGFAESLNALPPG